MTFAQQLEASITPLSPYTESASQLAERFFYAPNTAEACQHLHHLKALLRHNSGTHFHLHFSELPCYCILYTINGLCSLTFNGFDYALPSESVVFLDCRNGFDLYRENLENWSCYMLFVDGPTVPYFYSRFYKDEISGFLLPPASAFPEKINQIHSLTMSSWDIANSELLINKLLNDIFTTMLLEKNASPIINKSVPNHILDAVSFIEQNYQRPLCLDDIADALNISKYTLSHDYREYVGTPVMESIIEKRISHAKELLSTTNATVTDISSAVGFSNDNHFIQTFKKRVGITPLRYRKQHNIHSHTHILNS